MEAFDEIYRCYNRDVFRFLYKLCGYRKSVAEDLTQETFLHAYLGIMDFRGESGVKTWLLQIAKNRYFMFLRKEKKWEYLDDIVIELLDDSIENVTDTLYKKQLITDSLEIAFNFSDKMKSVFISRIYSGMTYLEIARELSISEGAAKMLFYRGKQQLRKKLKEDYGYEI